MSVLLADIDATCAALGVSDGNRYQAEPDAAEGLKVMSSSSINNIIIIKCCSPSFACSI